MTLADDRIYTLVLAAAIAISAVGVGGAHECALSSNMTCIKRTAARDTFIIIITGISKMLKTQQTITTLFALALGTAIALLGATVAITVSVVVTGAQNVKVDSGRW